MKKTALLIILALTLILANGCAKQEADYPNKPIELVSAYNPGGPSDRVARIFADYASNYFKQPVTVVNKPGGSGTTGTMYVVQAKPDGYTLLMHVIGAATANPALMKNLPYKYNDLVPIVRTNVNPVVFIVPSDSKWKTLKELVEDLKKEPSKYSYSCGGIGGVSTFGVAQLMDSAGIDPRKPKMVIYQSGLEAATAVAGGHVSFAAQNASDVIGLVKGGKLRALAVTTPERIDDLPDVPTTKEAGFEKVTMVGWNGIFGPKSVPEQVIKKWDEMVTKAFNDNEFVKKLREAGFVPAYMPQKDFTKFIEDEYNLLLKYAEQLGIRQ
ncbi:tripartite tricarboxylate transporter substrate binding protein [Neomoorella mulderi]|uniref:Tripartite tricarboxylate transporter family receptor n=1 Tax=Moorella mulderi DSM 14980 TaxID=1122241 RepID=A0A151ASW5_9FIRM|nr:tripartite tricarboxylate transporter substrate binding protein [Moorella mulderi]KYH30682.1 tripartite tricarboxylate transporter family receptor [Moorella mulderi DSM 14980]